MDAALDTSSVNQAVKELTMELVQVLTLHNTKQPVNTEAEIAAHKQKVKMAGRVRIGAHDMQVKAAHWGTYTRSMKHSTYNGHCLSECEACIAPTPPQIMTFTMGDLHYFLDDSNTRLTVDGANGVPMKVKFARVQMWASERYTYKVTSSPVLILEPFVQQTVNVKRGGMRKASD